MNNSNVVRLPQRPAIVEVGDSVELARLMHALATEGLTLRVNTKTCRMRIIDIPPVIKADGGTEE